MARPDSIESRGLQAHVDDYLTKNGSQWRYKDLVRMLDVPADKRPSVESLRKIFGVKGYSTMERWVAAYDQKQSKK